METDNSGQGSVEYLIIIGVVLVIALIVVGLSTFFASSSQDINQTEVDTYWSTQVRPLRLMAMQGHYYGASYGGEIALLVQNIDSKPVTLRNIIMGPDVNTISVYSNHSTSGAPAGTPLGYAGQNYKASPNLSIVISPSERVAIYLRVNDTSGSGFCADSFNSRSFRKNLTLQYDTPYFSQNYFAGVKPIQGKCSQSN